MLIILWTIFYREIRIIGTLTVVIAKTLDSKFSNNGRQEALIGRNTLLRQV